MAAVVGNCQNLHAALDLTKKHVGRKALECDAAHVRVSDEAKPMGCITGSANRSEKRIVVPRAEPRRLVLVVGDLLFMLGRRLRMEDIVHVRRALTRSSSSSADTGCAAPSSSSRARRDASSIQSFSASAYDSSSRLSRSLRASFARASAGRSSASASIAFASIPRFYHLGIE